MKSKCYKVGRDDKNEHHFLNKNNRDLIYHQLKKILMLGLDFKTRPEILKSKSFNDIFEMLNETLPIQGQSFDDLVKSIEEKILPYSTNFSSPSAMAFPDAGNSVASLAGAILSDLMNQNLINWKPCAPVATIIEIIVLNWLRVLVNYPYLENPSSPLDVGGIVTTGGVSSNILALLFAREKKFPETMKFGIKNIANNYVAIVPNGIDHYSSKLSMGWLGMGENNVIRAPTKNFKYDLDELQKILERMRKNAISVVLLTAYAGDSRSMTCDDFLTLRKLCDVYNIWFHIDGCHGTQLLFSSKYRHKLKGIEEADSITFDPHKVLNVPYPLSIFLLRNISDIKLCHRPEDIITGEKHSFGQVTPFFGSRSFMIFKLYLLIKHLGLTGISEVIDKRHEMAICLAEKIKTRENFLLINPDISINSVVFMYCPKNWKNAINLDIVSKLNSLNTEIQCILLEQGLIWLHNFNIPDLSDVFGLGEKTMLRPLRFMSGNPNIREANLDEMLNRIEICAQKILKLENSCAAAV